MVLSVLQLVFLFLINFAKELNINEPRFMKLKNGKNDNKNSSLNIRCHPSRNEEGNLELNRFIISIENQIWFTFAT